MAVRDVAVEATSTTRISPHAPLYLYEMHTMIAIHCIVIFSASELDLLSYTLRDDNKEPYDTTPLHEDTDPPNDNHKRPPAIPANSPR